LRILVINAGSSSLKYQLIDMENEQVIAKGNCEKIGLPMGIITHKTSSGKVVKNEQVFPTHTEAFMEVVKVLTTGDAAVINDIKEIYAIGHRVVQGAEVFTQSTFLNNEVIDEIDRLAELAPLHNHAHALAMRACVKVFGADMPQVAVFDNAFHQTMPPKAYLYGLPHEYYDNYKIRKYGFHGTSHSYVSNRTAEFCGLTLENSKIIVCHLGNGASISAVLNGKSVDTSMGFTPLSGLVMGTRSGDIDPSIIEYIAKKENKNLDQIMNLLNKQSGVQGMSDVSSDFRDINAAMDTGNELARTAFDVFVYRVAKYIGSYVAAMNGVDAIAFTAGVGENDHKVRAEVCEYLGYLGITIDQEANMTRGKEIMLSTPDSKVKVAVIPTNEELAIARETVALL
jgi:acetate kinase